MNLEEPVEHDHRVEVLVSGLQWRHGAQLAVDATLVSPLKATWGASPKDTLAERGGFGESQAEEGN